MKNIVICMMSLLILSLNTWAAKPKAKEQVSFLPPAFRAKFEQHHKSSLSGKAKKSTGVIDYEFPSKIRLETQAPDRIVFVSNPDKTWYYTAPFIEGEKGEVTIRPTTKNSLSYFFDALRQGLKSNKDYEVKAEGEGQLVTFQPGLEKELGINKALLKFEAGKEVDFKHLKSIDLSYTTGKSVLIELQYLDTDQTYATDYFVFFPPKDTKVNQ